MPRQGEVFCHQVVEPKGGKYYVKKKSIMERGKLLEKGVKRKQERKAFKKTLKKVQIVSGKRTLRGFYSSQSKKRERELRVKQL